MNPRAFRRWLLLLAALVAVSATTFPGAVFGFLFGVTIAFFVAGPSFLLEAALNEAGLPIPDGTIPIVLAAGYGVFALIVVGTALRAWRRDTADNARLAAFRAAAVMALPLMAWLSSMALVRAWPN